LTPAPPLSSLFPYTTLFRSADVLARFERLRGSRVLMASGTDEHGTPITYEADKAGIPPREFADRNNALIVEDLRRLGMTYDVFTDRKSTRLNSSHGSISYAV